MAEVETQQSEPAVPEPSGSVAVAAFQKALAADTSTPAEPEAEPQTEAPAASTASIVIPINKVPEKFRANPDAVFGAYENAERKMHQDAAAAAQLRRENEALQARIAAAEQVNRMQPRTEQPQPDQYAGLDEAVITDTKGFVKTTVNMAEQRAIAAAKAAAAESIQGFKNEQAEIQRGQALVRTFEDAKKLARDQGFTVSDQEWRQHIGNVATGIAATEGDAGLYNPKTYVDRFAFYKGTPKATIPEEGNPPVATRAAAATPVKAPAPTLSRELQAVNKRIREALNLPD